jgi:hypothetical protein
MSQVPPFKQYYPNTSDMSSEQKKFYEAWLRDWEYGKPISVDGQVSYLFCYANSIFDKYSDKKVPEVIESKDANIKISVSITSPVGNISSQNADKLLSEFTKIRDAYSNELVFATYCNRWIADCFIILKKYRSALESLQTTLITGSRLSFATDYLLSLKLLVGERVSGHDVLTLYGPRVTAFGKKHLDQISQYIDINLRAYELKNGISLLEEWKKTTSRYPYQVFVGTQYVSNADIESYYFSNNTDIANFVEQISREAENTVREESGLPKVGEGWVGETELFYSIKAAFPNYEVRQHARPTWLHNQHLDIYIPDLNVALEYQGIQHQVAIEYFGGEEAFKHRQLLDNRKLAHCKRNNVRLL